MTTTDSVASSKIKSLRSETGCFNNSRYQSNTAMAAISASKLTSYKCIKCNKNFKNREFLRCSECENTYNLLCTPVTSRSFKMMNKDEKTSWKCHACKGNQVKVARTSLALDTTEFKAGNLKSHSLKTSSIENLASSAKLEDLATSFLTDDSPKSLPNMSCLEIPEVSDLKNQLISANNELTSAHSEIERLNSENNDLKKQIEEYQKKHLVYNKLLNEETPKRHTPQRIRRTITATEIEKIKINQLENEISVLKKKILYLKRKINNILTENIQIKQKSREKEGITKRIKRKILALQKNIKSLAPMSNICQSSPSNRDENKLEMDLEEDAINKRVSKPKLLLLADSHGADVLRPLCKIRRNDYDATADIIQNGTSDRILLNFKEKIAEFKKSDCVVIMCGSMDYNINPIYNTITLLNEAVKLASHTNIVICDIPYSVNEYASNYNKFVKRFNTTLHKKIDKADYLWQMRYNINLHVDDYNMNGNWFNWRGKYKQAQCINDALKNVNERFYNKKSFLDVQSEKKKLLMMETR
jgi:TolA-binding protein